MSYVTKRAFTRNSDWYGGDRPLSAVGGTATETVRHDIRTGGIAGVRKKSGSQYLVVHHLIQVVNRRGLRASDVFFTRQTSGLKSDH